MGTRIHCSCIHIIIHIGIISPNTGYRQGKSINNFPSESINHFPSESIDENFIKVPINNHSKMYR